MDLIANGDDTYEQSFSPIEMVDKARAEKRAADPSFKDEDLMIRVIFCDDPDAWEETTSSRYVYETAKQLEAYAGYAHRAEAIMDPVLQAGVRSPRQ